MQGLPDSLIHLLNTHQSYVTTVQTCYKAQQCPEKKVQGSLTWHARLFVIQPLTFQLHLLYSLNTPRSFLSQCLCSFVISAMNDLFLPISCLSFKAQLKDHIPQETFSDLLHWVRGLSSIILLDCIFLPMHITTWHCNVLFFPNKLNILCLENFFLKCSKNVCGRKGSTVLSSMGKHKTKITNIYNMNIAKEQQSTNFVKGQMINIFGFTGQQAK